MLPDFMALKGLFKVDLVKNDTNIFRCHYKLTVIFLVTFATLVSLKQYIGDPIDCFVDGPSYLTANNHHTLDTFCWIHSTFTLPKQVGVKEKSGQQTGIPGLGTPTKDQPVLQHKYYQWVGFFLMFQAVCFYIPRMLWKLQEAGRLRQMVGDLKSVLVPTPVEDESKRNLADYLFSNINQHNTYALTFFFCELLTLVNIIGQIFLVDVFLGGEFTTYGIQVFRQSELDPEERVDPMSRIFPKVSKCTFKNYGPSGTVQIFDAFCVLPVNIINEKIFIFLWFWFLVLATLTIGSITIRLLTLTVPPFRLYLLQRQVGLGVEKQRVKLVYRHCQIGDWFLLMLIGQNVNHWIYQEVMDDLAERFEGKTI